MSLGQIDESYELTELDHESQRDKGGWHLGFESQSNELGDNLLRQIRSSGKSQTADPVSIDPTSL